MSPECRVVSLRKALKERIVTKVADIINKDIEKRWS